MTTPTASPPQAPPANAVARRDPAELVPTKVAQIGLATRTDVERFDSTVTLPPSFQYVIKGRKKVGNDWVDDNKVGITSDGYDYANRTLGAQFYRPEFAPDAEGNLVRNPIHKRDYIFLRETAIWYNEVGQLVSATEDLEVDFKMVYANARLSQPGAEPQTDATGATIFVDGAPVVHIHDHQRTNRQGEAYGEIQTAAAQEKRALEAYMQLRTMGLRYAQTVVRTRLLKIATGIKSLPLQAPAMFPIRIVGYRDRMTPQERQQMAESASSTLFGVALPRAPEARITDQELAVVEAADLEASVERNLAMAGAPVADEDEAQAIAENEPDDSEDPNPDGAPAPDGAPPVTDEFNFGG